MFVADPKQLGASSATFQELSHRQVDPHTPRKRCAPLYESSPQDPKRRSLDREDSTHDSHSPSIQITVFASPGTQRTWYMQKSLLARHSGRFRTATQDPSTTSISIYHDSLSDFQDFVDFVHSSIYSVNKHAPNYHPVGTNLQAWFLGKKLEAQDYQAAALCELYAWIEPLAHACNTSLAYTPIRTQDVEFVSINLSDGDAVREMILDAVVAHCTQNDAIAVCATLVSRDEDTIRKESDPSTGYLPHLSPTVYVHWAMLATKHRSFFKRIVDSQQVKNTDRTKLLRPIEEYLAGCTNAVKEAFGRKKVEKVWFASIEGSPKGNESGGGDIELDGKHMRSPDQRRVSSFWPLPALENRGSSTFSTYARDDEYMSEEGEFLRTF